MRKYKEKQVLYNIIRRHRIRKYATRELIKNLSLKENKKAIKILERLEDKTPAF